MGSHVMRASYAPNQTHEPHRALSTLALCLRDAAWIPAKDGSLRPPSAITAPGLGKPRPLIPVPPRPPSLLWYPFSWRDLHRRANADSVG